MTEEEFNQLEIGDYVRVNVDTGGGFTFGKIYEVGGPYHKDYIFDVGVVADDYGLANGWYYKNFDVVVRDGPW